MAQSVMKNPSINSHALQYKGSDAGKERDTKLATKDHNEVGQKNQNKSTSGSYETPKAAMFKKELTPEEKIEETRLNFVKIMAATFKHQSPDNPASTEQIAQTTATMMHAEEGMKTNAILHKIKDALSNNEISKALPFHGKQVQYDTSKKNFDGKNPVEFQYQLKYNDLSKPTGAHISSMITVLDKRGLQVFQTKGDTKKGTNSFKWDGKTSMGSYCPEGEYHIKVEASFVQQINGKAVKTPIEAGSFISGTVESVDMKDGEAKLKVNGKYISIQDIIKIENSLQEDNTPKVADYASYIGQTAELDNNNIEIQQQGNAIINYNCEIDRPGKACIKIINDKGEIQGVAVVSNVKKGQNKLQFKITNALTEEDAEKFVPGTPGYEYIQPGKYKYELYVQNSLATNPENYNKISTIRTVKITGLDFEKEPFIVAGDEKFKVDTIKKLSTTASKESIFQDALQYLGKTATLNLNMLKVEKGSAGIQYIPITLPEANTSYGDAYLNIYDKQNNQIAVVKKGSESLIEFNGTEFYNKDNVFNFLTQASKDWICQQNGIAPRVDTIEEVDAQIPVGPQHNARVAAFKNAVWEYLTSQEAQPTAYDDKLDYNAVWPKYQYVPAADKPLVKRAIDLNLPINLFQWDCKDLKGEIVPDGSYKYEFQLEKIYADPAHSGSRTELTKIPDLAKIRIEQYKTDKGELTFIGSRIKEGKIVAINEEFTLDEITSLSA